MGVRHVGVLLLIQVSVLAGFRAQLFLVWRLLRSTCKSRVVKDEWRYVLGGLDWLLNRADIWMEVGRLRSIVRLGIVSGDGGFRVC